MSGTADGVLYKRDLYTYRVFCRPGVRGTTNKNAPHDCEAFGAENETRTRDPDLGNRSGLCKIGVLVRCMADFDFWRGETFMMVF